MQEDCLNYAERPRRQTAGPAGREMGAQRWRREPADSHPYPGSEGELQEP